jgi:hypothetical protein
MEARILFAGSVKVVACLSAALIGRIEIAFKMGGQYLVE